MIVRLYRLVYRTEVGVEESRDQMGSGPKGRMLSLEAAWNSGLSTVSESSPGILDCMWCGCRITHRKRQEEVL